MIAKRIAIALLAFGATLAFGSQALAAPAPAWRLVLTSNTTNFAPGSSSADGVLPQYTVLATNVGGAPTSGPVTIADTLPVGLTPGPNNGCAVVAQTVTCTTAEPVPPGGHVSAQIKVNVDSGLAVGSTLESQASVSGGAAGSATASTTTTISSAPPPFDFLPGAEGLAAGALGEDGQPASLAGSHPATLTIDLGFPTIKPGPTLTGVDGAVRQIHTNLPRGMIVNPAATAVRCTEVQLEGNVCPDAAALGTINILTSTGSPLFYRSPLYNMVPSPGAAASFAFNAAGSGFYVHIIGGLRAGDYALSATNTDIPAQFGNPVMGVHVQLWGDPSDPSHDSARGFCADPNQAGLTCPVPARNTPLLSMPTSCQDSISIEADAVSWGHPEDLHTRSAPFTDNEGNPTGVDGCNALPFDPTLKAQPTTNLADSPTGLAVDLEIPQPLPPDPLGRTYPCRKGSWQNSPTGFSYQWLRNGTPIPGATTAVYSPGDADRGAPLQCEVKAQNATSGATFAASNALLVPGTVRLPAPSPGTPTVGPAPAPAPAGTLACEPGSWGGAPTFTYQWFKDGSPIPGQSGATYHPPSEAPLTLQCEVKGTDASGTTALAFSPNWTSTPAPEPALPNFTRPPDITLPLSDYPSATAHLKKAVVTLPEGLVVNPSSANGLAGCSSAQIGIDPATGIADGTHPACPDASRIGSVVVESPLLAQYDDQQRVQLDPETGNPLPEPLHGSVYLATPHDNPFDSLLAIYIAIDDPGSGIVVKLPGHVIADPTSGRLTTVFDRNPQLPFSEFKLNFFGGASAPLRTPPTCGTHTTSSELTPWSSPEGLNAGPSDSFQITAMPGGGPCPTSPGEAPNAPAFSAGSVSPQAAAYTPFVVHLKREDGTQQFASLTLSPPPGLIGRLAGTAPCPDSALAAAAAKSGHAERSNPSCPAASRLGTVAVAAGAGPTPFHTQGTAYLAGPYKGAPLSMAVITPAIAGPFDLGAVVVRAALFLDHETARIHAVSDPFPTILHGIPLDLRSVAVKLDRPSFTLNPTSCDVMAITGSATSVFNQTAPLTQRFQVGGCPDLGFKPKLSLALKGSTRRTTNPRLIANLTYPKGGPYANIAKAQVTLPKAAFLDNSHIKTICTRVQFAADTCPPGSIYGKATATSPLLDYPISGPVYLRSSSNKLPDLVVKLEGPASQPIEVDLVGRTDAVKGALRNTFTAVPDVPASSFHLELFGGKRGLVELSSGLCKSPRASVKLTAQNGKVYDTTPVVGTSCGAKKHAGKRKGNR